MARTTEEIIQRLNVAAHHAGYLAGLRLGLGIGLVFTIAGVVIGYLGSL